MGQNKRVRENVDEKRLLEFGRNLAEIRNCKGMTQEDLEEKTGLSQTQIARIETGAVNTTINTIFIISHALEIDPRELF